MTQTSLPEALPASPSPRPHGYANGESSVRSSRSVTNSCLCAPYLPDEALISEVGRFHITNGNRTTTVTYRQLFDCVPFNLHTSIPPHISILAGVIEGDIVSNTQHLLQTKTLFPLYQVFTGLSFQKFSQTRTRNRQNSDESPQRHHRVQRDPLPVPKRVLGDTTRLCLECVHEDIRVFGVPYLHLSHQVPGVEVCAKHAVALIYKCPHCECPFNRLKELVLSLWKPCRCKRYLTEFAPTGEKTDDAIALSYSKFSAEVLAAGLGTIKPNVLIAHYKKRARDLGYAWGTNVNRKRLFGEIEEFYGAAFLSGVDYAYKKRRLTGWFNLLNERYVTEVPLSRHLLFAHFLFRDAGQFAHGVVQISATVADDRDEQSKEQTKSGRHAKSARSPAQTNDGRAQELMRELLRTAQSAPDYTLEKLWRTNYGKMKRLAQLNPDAVLQMKNQLGKLKFKPQLPKKEILATHPRDEERSAKAGEAARRLYASAEKPCKVSRNQLTKDIQWRPGPSEALGHPATLQTFKEYCESNWYFYARRMVWAILYHKQASPSFIRLASGVEYHRSIELYNFFQTLDPSTALAEGTIVVILEKYGISRQWQGPCPERIFFPSGRGYYEDRHST